MSNKGVTQAKLLLGILSSGYASKHNRNYLTVMRSSVYSVPIDDALLNTPIMLVDKINIIAKGIGVNDAVYNSTSLEIIYIKYGPTLLNANDSVSTTPTLSILVNKVNKVKLNGSDSVHNAVRISVIKITVARATALDSITNTVTLGVTKQ